MEDENNDIERGVNERHLKKIGDLLEEVGNHSLKGAHDLALRILKELKSAIIQDLNPKEKKELQNIEDTYDNFLIIENFARSPSSWKDNVNVPEEAAKRIEQWVKRFAGKLRRPVELYREKIMILLVKYGYIQDRSGEE